jgi:hypothetical protein
MDPVLDPDYQYPEGRYSSSNGARRHVRNVNYPGQTIYDYCKPIWRWSTAFQNDWAARADWCVKSYTEANHQPVIRLNHPSDLDAEPGSTVELSAKGTSDPDGDELSFKWWYYEEASGYEGEIEILNPNKRDATLEIPDHIGQETNLHVVCEVTDNGSPPLTRYKRVVIKVTGIYVNSKLD